MPYAVKHVNTVDISTSSGVHHLFFLFIERLGAFCNKYSKEGKVSAELFDFVRKNYLDYGAVYRDFIHALSDNSKASVKKTYKEILSCFDDYAVARCELMEYRVAGWYNRFFDKYESWDVDMFLCLVVGSVFDSCKKILNNSKEVK